MSESFPYDVFLSYSSHDKPVVVAVAERLRADGLHVWLDDWEIGAGATQETLQQKIEEGLGQSRVLVLCMSANAFGSDWTQLEAGTFRFRDPLNKERRFIPLRLDDAPIPGSLAQFLYINWLLEVREQEYATLLEACREGESTIGIQEQEQKGWSVAHPEEVVIDRDSRDDFSKRIKDTLARRVGMRCSNMACQRLTSGPQSDPNRALNIGVAAHITAASAGGPRYAPTLSKRERSSIENGIWLCQNCAKLVDNDETRYAVEILRRWKMSAEQAALRDLETSGTPVTLDPDYRSPMDQDMAGAPKRVLDPSPFHPVGAIGLGEKSYVTRASDCELRKAVEHHDFIWLQGDFQMGKSSLLRRHNSWLGGEWIAVCPDLELCNRATNDRFWSDFFAEIDEATGEWQHNTSAKARFDWRALRVLVQEHRVAFLLDEIGTCRNHQIKQLIESIYSLAEKAPGHVKLVVSFLDGPVPLLPQCGIRNPKHTATWRMVRLESFTVDEVQRLIELFPNGLSALLFARIERLRALTDFKPQKVQYLLHNLWEELTSFEPTCNEADSFLDDWISGQE